MRSKVAAPIVVDLGRTRDAKIRQFGDGAGQLVDDVEEVMRLVRRGAGADSSNRIFLPVVVVYRRARRDESDAEDDASSTPLRTQADEA